jgi:DNA-binding response OmpR family regulator
VTNQAEILQARILIVDDQLAEITLLQHLLVRAGYTAVAATLDSSQVCDLHRRNRYDLILLDLHMPGMDGFEVLKGLRRVVEGGRLPIMVVSGHPQHKLRALYAGAQDFVAKPIDLADVLQRIHAMLARRLLATATGPAAAPVC